MSVDAKTLIEKVVKGADPKKVVEGVIRWKPANKWKDSETAALFAKLLGTRRFLFAYNDKPDMAYEDGEIIGSSISTKKEGIVDGGKYEGLTWRVGVFDGNIVAALDDGMGDITYFTAKPFDV